MSTALNELYSSGGDDVILKTLEIDTPSGKLFLMDGFEDFNLTLEDGTTQLFTACGIDLSLPSKNGDGTQDLTFSISNITGVVSGVIRDTIKENHRGSLIMRLYLLSNPSSPESTPLKLKLKGGYWDYSEAQILAGYMNLLDTYWPRKFYNNTEHPGLRWI